MKLRKTLKAKADAEAEKEAQMRAVEEAEGNDDPEANEDEEEDIEATRQVEVAKGVDVDDAEGSGQVDKVDTGAGVDDAVVSGRLVSVVSVRSTCGRAASLLRQVRSTACFSCCAGLLRQVGKCMHLLFGVVLAFAHAYIGSWWLSPNR